ncbi:MAG: hypothetical protein AB7Q97_09985 [Gammaproteobacteria bacterium]
MKRAFVLLAAMTIAATGAMADEVTIRIGQGSIDPAQATIQAGDTVVFENTVDAPGGQTVLLDDGSGQSPTLQKDDVWVRAFDDAGSYPYHLKENPEVKGSITVQ